VVGGTVTAVGWGCLNWSFQGGGLSAIAASWVISPVASGLVGAGAYLILTFIIFKRDSNSKNFNPRAMAIYVFPVLVYIISYVISFLIFLKARGCPAQILNLKGSSAVRRSLAPLRDLLERTLINGSSYSH
jgi:phosphate/sulfate permease